MMIMKMKLTGIAKITAVLIVLLLLCGTCAAEETREFTDDLGRTMKLPMTLASAAPSGVAAQAALYSISPDIMTSLSDTLDDGEKKYLDKRLASLPVTGSFYGAKSTMNAEQIMELNKKLKFDAVIDVGSQKTGIADDLNEMQKKTGVPFVYINQDKITDFPTSYRRLGELIGNTSAGEERALYLENLLKLFDENMKKVGDKKVSMIYVTNVNGNSAYMVGSGENSVHGEIINKIAENLAPKAVSQKGLGDMYSLEDIIMLDPDYIIVGWEPDHTYYNEILKNPSWQSLRAVKEGRVFETPGEPYPWMGNPLSVNRFLSILWLGNLFYPEVFDYPLQDKAAEFYQLFYHHTLTDNEYQELTQNALAGKHAAQKTPSPASPAGILGIIGGLAAALILRRI